MWFPHVKNVYKGEVDVFATVLTYIVFFMFCGAVYTLILVKQSSDRIYEKKQAFTEACIEEGGYPAYPMVYVRGHGEGYICIKPDGFVKMEKK